VANRYLSDLQIIMDHRTTFEGAVDQEREHQVRRGYDAAHDDDHSCVDWAAILCALTGDAAKVLSGHGWEFDAPGSGATTDGEAGEAYLTNVRPVLVSLAATIRAIDEVFIRGGATVDSKRAIEVAEMMLEEDARSGF
jgi:hypothetical protein